MVKELPTQKAAERRYFLSSSAERSIGSNAFPRYRHSYAAIMCMAFSAGALLLQILKTQPNGGLFNTTRFISIATGRSAYSDSNHRLPWTETLPLDMNATLADDVLSIQHDVYNSRVIVTIRWNARCQQPYLIGRLSGPALVKVDNWTFHVHHTPNTTLQNSTMEGTYRAPVGGQYFLEIVSLYCQDVFYKLKHEEELLFQEETQTLIGNENTTALTVQRKPVDWLNSTKTRAIMQYNFAPLCMENPFHHRLTVKGATIWVDPDTAEKQRAATKHIVGGFWYYRPSKKPNTTADPSSINGTVTVMENETQKPLYTRHQPYDCMIAWQNRTIMPFPPECVDPASPERYRDYQFQWNPHLMSKQRHHGRGPPLMRMESLVLPKPSVICFIGASHSRFFKEASQRLNITQSNNNLTVHWAEIRFPTEIFPHKFDAYVKHFKCDKIVIAVGQWPASYRGGPTSVFNFYAQMKVALGNLVKYNITQQADVYARNIHYNPLAHFISSCPPTGWRNPMVIDGYNAAIQQVCRELSPDISYLDTQLLTDAIWDGSPDWCHLDPQVAEEELLYVSASVFGLLPSSNWEEDGNVEETDAITPIVD